MPSSPLLTIVIVLFVIGRFLIRELRERRLDNTQLFVLPGILFLAWAFVAYQALATSPGSVTDFFVRSAIAIPFGAVVGFGVAHFTTVRLGPGGNVFFRGSYVTVAIWVVALLVRIGIRFAFPTARSGSLDALASLVLLAFVASTVVRFLIRRKAHIELATGTPGMEAAL